MPLRCDVCGCFISTEDIESGAALRRFLTPDSFGSHEEFETLCPKHNWKPKLKHQCDGCPDYGNTEACEDCCDIDMIQEKSDKE